MTLKQPIMGSCPPLIAYGNNSKKANPNALSFLDLPGELRNKVYAICFNFPDALRITSYKSNLHRLKGDDNRNLNSKLTESHEDEIISHYKPSEGFDCILQGDLIRASLPGRTFLATCRTVYHEAAPMLYGNNTFVITHKVREFDFEKKDDAWEAKCREVQAPAIYRHGVFKYHDSEGRFIWQGAHWLQGLGSQMRMLKKVVIDVDNICPWSCTEDQSNVLKDLSFPTQMLDVAPLLFVLWSRDVPLDISFSTFDADSPTLFDRILRIEQPMLHSPREERQGNYARLTELLKRLVKDDIGIKRYRNLIGKVAVCTSGIGGVILYKTTTKHQCAPKKTYPFDGRLRGYHACHDMKTEFVLRRRRCVLKKAKPKTNFYQLLTTTKGRIFRSVLQPRDTVKIDIDKHSDLGPATGFLYLQRRVPELYWKLFWKTNKFELTLSSSEQETTFSDFRRLRRWLCIGTSSNYSFRGCRAILLKEAAGFCVNLDFRLRDKASLEDLRIGVMGLILATARVDGRTTPNGTAVRFRVLDLNKSLQDEEFAVDLSLLRQRVLGAINKIVEHYPNVAYSLCPEIWINGRGDPVEFTEPFSKEKVAITELQNSKRWEYQAGIPNNLFRSNSSCGGWGKGSTKAFYEYLCRVQLRRSVHALADEYFAEDFARVRA